MWPTERTRRSDDVYAIGDRGTHENVSLSEGEVLEDDRLLECWKHGSQFSLLTGEPVQLPALRPTPVYRSRSTPARSSSPFREQWHRTGDRWTHVRCSAGRQTPWPRSRCAIAQAVPVARFLAVVACGPLQPPSTVSWKIWSQRSNSSGVNSARSWRWRCCSIVSISYPGEEQDVTPVVGDRADVGLPVDEPGSEVEVRLEEIVLADVNVLACHHLEDLGRGVEIAPAMFPRARPVGYVDVHRTGDHGGVGFAEELDVELGVRRGFDLVLDTGHDDGAVAGIEAHVTR